MKRLFLFAVINAVFCGSFFSTPVVIENERYVTIFDDVNLCGEKNFNLIRLYKVAVKPKFRKVLPANFVYTGSWNAMVEQLKIAEYERCHSLGYKKTVTDENNRQYFYKTFSQEVDKYIFERLAISSTSRIPAETNVWDVPGEILYFDAQTKEPHRVDVGTFQYTITQEGLCLDRGFVPYGSSYLVDGKKGIHRCWKQHHHLDRLPVYKQIFKFLSQQKNDGYDLFSKLWCKDLLANLLRYNSVVGIDFV